MQPLGLAIAGGIEIKIQRRFIKWIEAISTEQAYKIFTYQQTVLSLTKHAPYATYGAYDHSHR